mgnify:CR=1 FL=1
MTRPGHGHPTSTPAGASRPAEPSPPPLRLLVEQGIRDVSGQILLRSRLHTAARRLGFDAQTRDYMEMVCSEITTNQIKYAEGTGLFQIWESRLGPPALELFGLDHGPGIGNIARARRDGVSSAGTLGRGLGSIGRLGHQWDLYTLPRTAQSPSTWHGLAVWVRFYLDGAERASGSWEKGGFLRAYQDLSAMGDWLGCSETGPRLRWLHLDGLGHGLKAAEAIAEHEGTLESKAPLERALESLDARLRGGRGAVALLGEADLHRGEVSLCGVGDLVVYVIQGERRQELSFPPGILGHAHRRIQTEAAPLNPDTLVLSASDGVRTNWDLSTFPGLWHLHPQLIALFLGHNAGRTTDDRSLFAVRPVRDTHGRKGARP